MYKTPGVYVEEISKFPPSIAAVETALPAFIGYTEKAEKEGESLTNQPTRIGSLLEFVEYYGVDHIPADINVKVDTSNAYSVTEVSISNQERYMMYDSLRIFYDNGGGDCYIVSVGKYGIAPSAGDENNPTTSPGLRVGIKALEKVDPPTIILFPDASMMLTGGTDDPSFYAVQQMALAQCAKLQDRVAVFDLKENVTGGQPKAVENFRNNVGMSNLKYGAAYTPWIYTSYQRDVDFSAFKNKVTPSTGGPAIDLSTVTTDSILNAMITNANKADAEIAKVDLIITAIKRANSAGVLNVDSAAPSMKDKFKTLKKAIDDTTDPAVAKPAMVNLMNFSRNALLEFQKLSVQLTTANLLNDLKSYATSVSLWRGAATSLIKIDRNDDVRVLTGLVNNALAVDAVYPSIDVTWLGGAINLVPASLTDYGDSTVNANLPAIGKVISLDIQEAFDKISAFGDTMLNSAKAYKKASQDLMYQSHPVVGKIVNQIKKELSKIPPSGAVAGIYARVDNAQGVWKAPANESINSIIGSSVNISHEEQANLNVDVVSGKSINAIRAFTGKGTLIFGARTLAGNDNEWRYVSVRRLFNMVEESTKKATEQFVFEPNDANTWVKVQAMIENFLNTLWRQGALQGVKPEHAFYVAVGLGKTMTALDILEGRMIIEIGMAAVRPAEFIILRFSHKMPES